MRCLAIHMLQRRNLLGCMVAGAMWHASMWLAILVLQALHAVVPGMTVRHMPIAWQLPIL